MVYAESIRNGADGSHRPAPVGSGFTESSDTVENHYSFPRWFCFQVDNLKTSETDGLITDYTT